jgi:hypothetical protein
MDDVTRRSFVKSGAGAAAGLIAVGTFAVPQADAKTKGKSKDHHHHHRHSDPIVAWIGNPRDGHITVMSGNGEVTIRDHKLAEKLARAAR